MVGEAIEVRRDVGVAPARPPQAVDAEPRDLEEGDLAHLGGFGDIVNREPGTEFLALRDAVGEIVLEVAALAVVGLHRHDVAAVAEQHQVLRGLDAVRARQIAEREAATIEAYVQQRKVVGSLTAELSYLLIRPFLQGDEPELRNFLRNVGAVGCLVDSVIDLRHDAGLNLVSFTPTGGAFLILLIRTLTEGLRLSIRYPALLGLFIEAVVDNVRDRFRVRAPAAPRLVTSSGKEGVPSAI